MARPSSASASTGGLGVGTLRTGLASMRRSSSAAWRMRCSSDRQAITVSWPTWPRSSFCQRRTTLTVIARSCRGPKNGTRYRRSRPSVACKVAGLRSGSADQTSHHSRAQVSKVWRPRRGSAQVPRARRASRSCLWSRAWSRVPNVWLPWLPSSSRHQTL